MAVRGALNVLLPDENVGTCANNSNVPVGIGRLVVKDNKFCF
jgi:hypothetical protein